MVETFLAVPDGYADLREHLNCTVVAARWQAQRVVSTELLRLLLAAQ